MASPSEFELIRSIAATVGPARRARLGIGDDAAVIEGGGRFWLFAADMMIEDVHFSRELSSLEDVGWKALAVNISDIAAMGGLPRYATVSLGLTATDEAAGVYRGLAACARAFDVEIVGGDLVRSPRALVIDVAILGECTAAAPVTRAGAKPGNVVVVTGALGAAAAGLAAWRHKPTATADPAIAELILAQRRPQPRLEAGRRLAELGATAMLDVSDGLAGDAGHIANQSGLAIVLEANRIPVHPGAAAWATAQGSSALDLALYGGEDYELIACLPADRYEEAAAALAALGTPLSHIGRCEPGEGVWLEQGNSRVALKARSWDHFRPPAST